MGFVRGKSTSSNSTSRYEDYFMDAPGKVKKKDTNASIEWDEVLHDFAAKKSYRW